MKILNISIVLANQLDNKVMHVRSRTRRCTGGLHVVIDSVASDRSPLVLICQNDGRPSDFSVIVGDFSQ